MNEDRGKKKKVFHEAYFFRGLVFAALFSLLLWGLIAWVIIEVLR